MKKIVALVLSLVMALGLATTAFAALATFNFYSVSDVDGSWVAAPSVDAWFVTEGVDEFDDLVADDEHYLPCYKIGGGYFVEVPEAAATNKVVYGTQTLYLSKLMSTAPVYFDVEAEVFTNVVDEDDVCGALYYATLDDEDVFYASYDKASKTYTYYVKVATGEDVVLLVDGKLVKADIVGTTLNQHSYVGNTVVNKAYVDVKCANCGKVAALYANATAAGKLAQPVGTLGYITFADMFTYGVAADAPAATDKVESAQTFDAGIAMYVGMSVMAAAGSAVVLKKKD